jgi:Trk K+ transport system NAD-binding subunit
MHKVYRVYRYALFLLDRFKYLALLAMIVFAISTWVIWHFHPDQARPETRRDLVEVAFSVFGLMFVSQAAMPYPRGSVAAQLVYFILPVLNVLGFAAAVAQFSQILFDRTLYNRAQANNADGHVILCGLGRLGREVLKQLDARHDMKSRRDVVIIDSGGGVEALDAEFVQREPIIPVVNGNMIHPSSLRDAGIERAAAIMMLSGDDTTNLEAALLARDLNPGVRVVLRMSNKHVTQRLDTMLRGSLVRNFQLIDSVEGSAPKCLELCRVPLDPPHESQPHIIICGLGRLGFGVIEIIKGRIPAVVIDMDERPHYCEEPIMMSEPVIPILRGDMRDKTILQDAGIDRAAAILFMTPNDTYNLEAAMVAHEVNPRIKIVMRIDNSRISDRLDRVLREAFGESIRVIDPAEHSAPHFVEAIRVAYESDPLGGGAHVKV